MRLIGVRVAGIDDRPCRPPCRRAGVVAEDLGDVGHVPAALAHGLAGVQRLLGGELLEVAVEEVGHAIEQRGALADVGARPVGRVEGAAGGGDRALDLRVVATSTSVTTVPSDGLTTLLQAPSPDATH